MSKNNQPGIEEKIARLEKLVTWFDSDEFVLERALDQYEQAQKLAVEIEHDITQIRNTIEQVDTSASV